MLHELINIAVHHKHKNAIFCDGKSYTYQELYDTAFGIKVYLEDKKIDKIGVYTDNNFYSYAVILGIVLANKTFVPLNHKFPFERLSSIINALDLKYAMSCSASASALEKLGLKSIVTESIDSNVSWEVDFYDSNKMAYALFTSGSTGTPKGIPIKYKNLEALLNNIFYSLPMEKEDKVLQTFELSFDVSIACTFMTWYKGATLYLSPLEGIIAVNAFRTVLENKLNWVCIAPSAITYLKKLKLLRDYPLPFVTTTVFTGEALPYLFTQDWNDCAIHSAIYNAYGPTENTVWSFVHELDDRSIIENGLVPIGKPLVGFNYFIKEEDNISGELYVNGAQVFDGYVKDKIKSDEVLINIDGSNYYKTGDIVKKQSNGNITYLNRADNQVQINGYRVELGEVEHKVKSFLNVENCIAFIQDSNKQLVVVIEAKHDIEKQSKLELLKILPFYMQPKKFYRMDNFPLNNNFKIDRKKIKMKFNGN